MTVTREQARAAIDMLMVVGDMIREAKQIPSGELYALLMGHLTMADYNHLIGILKGAGVVKEEGHLLTWIGPERRVN